MNTLIYARFSSTLQNARSIEDQVSMCRERCDTEGWTVAGVYTDFATSGAAGIGPDARPGLNAMLARVDAGGIDQVMAEATDRLARHQGDAHAIRERILFADARLFTLSDGEVSEITATFRGMMDAQFRRDLGTKVRRGQVGTVREGRSPAGLAYGYRKAPVMTEKGDVVRGLRAIDADQAEIVRRIFTEYAAGLSPRDIAARLNAEAIPAPRGGKWRGSTIAGDRARQNGILQNRLYIGQLVHLRTRKKTDPTTRRTLIKPNAADDWISSDVPDLRIVDDALFEAVQLRRTRHATGRPETQRRPRQLLSGLVTCGTCGSGFIVIKPGRWGCGLHREGGNAACDNARTIATDDLQSRTLAGLQDRLLSPDLVEIYVREYHAERARNSADMRRERSRAERRHAEAVAKVERLVEAVANGGNDFVEIRDILTRARADRDALAAQLADMDSLPVVALHPTVIRDYREQVAALTTAMAKDPEARLEAIPHLRSLIDRVTVFNTPGKRTPPKMEITGRLTNILALATGAAPAERMTTMERVNGFGRYHTFASAAI